MHLTKKYALVFLTTLFAQAVFAQVDTAFVDEGDYNASLALYDEAKLLIEEENYALATNFLQQAYDFYNGNSDYTYAAAFAFYKLDSLDDAANKIEWSLGLEPFQSDYLMLAGNIAYKSKSYEEAVRFYSRALQFQDSTDVAIDDLSCYYNRGNCYLKLEEYKAADKDYSYVLDIDPSNYMAFHNRAQARLRAGDRRGACVDFQEAINAGSKFSRRYLLKYCQ